MTAKNINYDSVTNTFTTYDSLKYNEDLTSKNLDLNDVVTYKLNNEFEVSVTIGESITMDWDGDGTETTEIVDDTNFNQKYCSAWLKLAVDRDIKCSEKVFDTSVSECIKRDSEREKSVGKDVILRIAKSREELKKLESES